MDRLDDFQVAVIPHMAAAYRLAYQIVEDENEAQDIVQDAYMRAWRAFGKIPGGNARHWLLKIVRNISVYRVGQRERSKNILSLDDAHSAPDCGRLISDLPNAEERMVQSAGSALISRAFDEIAPIYQDVLRLREIEELAYRDIAGSLGLPIGTVMSRLARGREQLKRALKRLAEQERLDDR